MGDNDKAKEVNDAIDGATNSIKGALGMFDGIMNRLIPQTAVKNISIEIVEKKGFCGIGRKTKKIPAAAYISMNNIICFDITDKNEMKKYFDDLK